jgi:hypothetical protein
MCAHGAAALSLESSLLQASRQRTFLNPSGMNMLKLFGEQGVHMDRKAP